VKGSNHAPFNVGVDVVVVNNFLNLFDRHGVGRMVRSFFPCVPNLSLPWLVSGEAIILLPTSDVALEDPRLVAVKKDLKL
jgi:hypothetical protein